MRPSLFLAVQAAAVLVPAAAGVLTVLRGGKAGEPRGVGRVFAATIAVGLVSVVCLVALLGTGVNAFGAIRMLYLGAVVALPLTAVLALVLHVGGRARLTRAALVLTAVGLAPAAVGAWATFVEPARLVVETADVTVPASRAGVTPVRIGVLADLQTDAVGAHERDAVDRLLAAECDLLLVPGDVFQGYDDQWEATRPALRDLLARLDAPFGVWFVVGDVDDDRTLALLRETRVRPLLDEVVRIPVRDRIVTIGGISGALGGDVIHRLLTDPGADDVRILLCHHPDPVLSLPPDSRIDLVVTGHTHGGQIVVPGFGPPMTLSRVPREVAAGGLHRMDGNAIYVSRGVGMERKQAPRMRLFCPPEISVLTLGASAPPRE